MKRKKEVCARYGLDSLDARCTCLRALASDRGLNPTSSRWSFVMCVSGVIGRETAVSLREGERNFQENFQKIPFHLEVTGRETSEEKRGHTLFLIWIFLPPVSCLPIRSGRQYLEATSLKYGMERPFSLRNLFIKAFSSPHFYGWFSGGRW